MKLKIIVLLLCAVFFSSCLSGGDEEDDEKVHDDFDAAVVCPESGTNTYGMPNRGTFVDERDGNSYRYTTIGKQVWMAQNLRYREIENKEDRDRVLNYLTEVSYCHYEEDLCTEKGRIYSYGYSKKFCPPGWHLPNGEEWSELIQVMGGDSLASIRLKSKNGWNPLNPGDNGNGTDDCGFNVLPAITTIYGYDGYRAYFWTETPVDHYKRFDTDEKKVFEPMYSAGSSDDLSVRCVKN
jgi:Fibrobacter succinogenes major domain (Fib_succ_major).